MIEPPGRQFSLGSLSIHTQIQSPLRRTIARPPSEAGPNRSVACFGDGGGAGTGWRESAASMMGSLRTYPTIAKASATKETMRARIPAGTLVTRQRSATAPKRQAA
jgi:hypothetical protein